MAQDRILKNLVYGEWCISNATSDVEAVNPAAAQIIARTPLSPASEVDGAGQAAQKAFYQWRTQFAARCLSGGPSG